MKKRLMNKTKFVVLSEDVIDSYLYDNYLRFTACAFYLTIGGGQEKHLPIREGTKEFWKAFSKYNSTNEVIYITEEDFVVLRCYLKYPENFIDSVDKILKEQEILENEQALINEDESDEDFLEEYNDDYNPQDDNFNIDDVESDYYE